MLFAVRAKLSIRRGFVADILSVFTSSNIAGLEFSDKVNVTEFAFHAAIAFVCIITVSALYTMIVMISHKQLISLGIAVILTLALLTLGGKSVSSLNQSSTWTDPITHEIVENNINQAVKLGNSQGKLYYSDIDKLQSSLDDVKKTFGEVLEVWRLQRS